MPFEPALLRPFTTDAIRTGAPTASGVYGISDGHRWIYIGEADSIQTALLAQVEKLRIALPDRPAAEFAYELCGKTARAARQDRLVLECEPTCNRLSTLLLVRRHG